MKNYRGWRGRVWLIWAAFCVAASGTTLASGPSDGDALVVRVIHPDRQAANILKLFEGARAAHPAAALAAWKRATRDPAQLGKTLEAFIALSNPEMVHEWKIFHEAELHMNVGPKDSALRWYFVAPRDDGSAAAMITAFRLSDLEDAPVFDALGQEHVVARVIRTAGTLVTHVGTSLVLAGSRDELECAIRRLDRGASSFESPGKAPAGRSDPESDFGRFARTVETGLVFDLRPAQIVLSPAGSLEVRRAIELLQALDCERILGTLALEGERLALDVTTRRNGLARFGEGETPGEPTGAPARTSAAADRPPGITKPHLAGGGRHPEGDASPRIDPAWLALLPAHDLIGIVSLAVDADPRFLAWAFAVADRVERVDPAYRDAASLRTRFNLLAKGGGLRPEADLWPHLRGITAAAVGDPQKPGRIGGVIVVLHADTVQSAVHLADQFVPRLAQLGKGKLALSSGADAARTPGRAAGAGLAATDSGPPHRLGTIAGRSLAVRRVGGDVLVGWGDETAIETLGVAGQSRRSAADVCAGWERENKPAPSRVGAIWPARLAPPLSPTVAASPAARVLAEDPPVVWWGWTEKGEAHDVLFWPDLKRRVSRFLEKLPMDAPPYR